MIKYHVGTFWNERLAHLELMYSMDDRLLPLLLIYPPFFPHFSIFYIHGSSLFNSPQKVSGVRCFKHHTGFLITNELWQVCWVAPWPILSVMPADSLAVFSQHWNMWKKLVFYISQLVASSAGWPMTPHRDPNAHKGSVPGLMRREKGRQSLWEIYVLAYKAKGTMVPSAHMTASATACIHFLFFFRARWGGFAWEVNPILVQKSWIKRCPAHNTSSTLFSKQTWHLGLICIQIRSRCITSGANYGIQMWGDYVKGEGNDRTDNFNLAKNGNPIQRGKEEQIIPAFSSLLSSLKF